MKLRQDEQLGLVAARSCTYITINKVVALEEHADEFWRVRSKDRNGNGVLRQSRLLRAMLTSKTASWSDRKSAPSETVANNVHGVDA